MVSNANLNKIQKKEYLEREPVAQMAMRDYMSWYKKCVNRNDGNGLKITKLHQLLHFFYYALVNGLMCNFYGNRPECIGITIVKDPGARTQHQVSKLTYRAVYNLCKSRNIDALAVQLQQSQPNLFEEYDTEKCFLSEPTIVNESEEIIIGATHNTLEQDPVSAGPSIISKGSRFSLTYFRNVMRFKWASRKKYLSTWDDQISTPLQNLVFGKLNLNNNKIDILGFTELKVMEELEVADSTGSKTVEHKY